MIKCFQGFLKAVDRLLRLVPSETHDPFWLHILTFLSGKQRLTQITYLGALKNLLDFFKIPYAEIKRLSSITPLMAGVFVESLKIGGKGLWRPQSSNTIRKKISALRKIFKLLQSAGLIKLNPFVSELLTVPKPDSQVRPTEMISFEKVTEFIESALDQSSASKRDACILAFLFGLGLRRSEVVRITIQDLKVSPNGTKYVVLRKTKSGKSFSMPLNDLCLKYLEQWLLERNKLKINSMFLFPLSVGRSRKKFMDPKPVSVFLVYRLFKKAVVKLGLPLNLSPHSARATAITKLLSDGFDLKEVQTFSRHSSIAMVAQYDKRRFEIENNPALRLKFDKTS